MATTAILLCTYNGERFIRQQLDSIRRQTVSAWRLYVSDDGSSDKTLAIVRDFQAQVGGDRVVIFAGPREGFSRNFFSLVAREDIVADVYAFADQDDEWHESKLARATAAFVAAEPGAAMLYGSRSEFVDEEGRHLGFSRLFTKAPGFRNALVQNMVTGNTLVLNRAAMTLLRRAGTDIRVSAHDWWAYLLVTGNGGGLIYDHFPTIYYRQHGKNLYGSNTSLRDKWARISKLFKGDFRAWNALNIHALQRNRALLNDDSRRGLELFERAHGATSALGAVRSAILLLRSGVYRQTLDGQVALFIAALVRRI